MNWVSKKQSYFILTIWLGIAFGLFTSPGFAQDPFAASNQTTLGLSSDINGDVEFLRVEEAYQVQIHAHEASKLELAWYIEPTYYLYQSKFKFKINGTPVDAIFEEGKVKYDEYFEQDLEVFYDSTIVTINEAPTEPFQLTVTSQGCADAGLCYPPYTQYFDVDPITGTAQEVDGASQQATASTETNVDSAVSTAPFNFSIWITSIIFAVLGGVILNLMPCVFPVLSIKALSLANSHENRHKIHMHGWAYTLGCIFTFVAIASIMLVLRASGEAVGWGFQLQSPIVITVLLYLFFLMGLSFSGFVNLGSSFMGIGQTSTQGKGLQHSLMTGALASVVASPCTAPMMGAALGYAITQPTAIALSVFAALGFGMALPFLLLTYIPKLAAALPKPGVWMDTLKQFLAFPLYLSCVWLLWVLANQTNINHLAIVSSGLVMIAFALWMLQHTPNSKIWQASTKVVAFSSFAFALLIGFSYKPPVKDDLWQAYSPEKLQELRSNDQAVFVNLTASWCITCLANEKVALSKDSVRDAMVRNNIQGLKGDWTNADPLITELLKKYGRSGVPLYLYYPSSSESEAVILPQLLTPEIVLNAIDSPQNEKVAEVE
jgi:thiol:disulfide interchange protein DsbD